MAALARGRAPRGPSAVDAAASAVAEPAQPAAEGVAGGRAASVPLRGRALCALSTAVGAPSAAPGCRKGVQREPRGMACGGPGGGGLRALPLGGCRGMEKPAGSWAGSAGIYSLERNILVVQIDRGRRDGALNTG